MFKKSIAVAVLAIASIGAAQAQTQPNLFKSQTGVPFNVDAVESVEYKTGYLQLYFDNNFTNGTIVDGTGIVYASLTSNPYFLSKFVRAGNTNRWLNTDKIVLAQCNSNYTTIYWAGRGRGVYYTEAVADAGCSTFVAIQAKAN